jgi:hypothetical protein
MELFISLGWEPRMEPNTNVPEETVAELCKRADSEQNLEKLLELASRLQALIESRRSPKAPKGTNVTSPAKFEPPDA